MKELVTFEWSFSPEDYIEHRFTKSQVEFEFLNGKVKATLPASLYKAAAERDFLDKLHNRVKTFLDGIKISKRKPYTLSKARMIHLRSDGKKDYKVFIESICSGITVSGDIHFIVKDKAGNIIRDTKAEEKQAMLEFAELSAKHADDLTVSKLIQAFTASEDDPANEFVHLYEIKDTLKLEFGGEKEAKKTLGISDDDWKPIGKFPNEPSIRQGRHRGQRQSDLRDATPEELASARQSAKKIILSYLKYKD